MVLNNLFAGQWQRCRTDLWTQSGEEKVGWMERVAWKHVHYRM